MLFVRWLSGQVSREVVYLCFTMTPENQLLNRYKVLEQTGLQLGISSIAYVWIVRNIYANE